MTKQISSLRSALALCAVLAAGVAGAAAVDEAANARPLVPAERRYNYFQNNVPACDDPAVFERIQGRFHDREAEFWNTGLEIMGFDDVTEIGYKTNGLDYIPRRYCSARAYMNDTKWRSVYYSIDEDQGIIGFGFGVTWCVDGLDRNGAYAPHCRMARP